jgi:NadR type nicotinamide-nucleotide adenylyltransferase
MPPHLGHVYLVDFARHYCDDLTVVVGSLASESIPGRLRFDWMVELFPTVRVVHLMDELPQDPSEHPDFWALWQSSLQRVVGHAVDFVFASETYGTRLAEVLNARFVPVDIDRSVVPISGMAVRDNPLRHWQYLPDCVRPYFVKRVCLCGPESTGKSTLSMQLAQAFHTVAVPEYARSLLMTQGGRVGEEDMPVIARGQVASEDALARRANRVLICDTDALTTAVWSEALFGRCSDAVHDVATGRRYDLTLLLDVDVPWVADSVRYLPDHRASFRERLERALTEAGRSYELVRGPWAERLATAHRAVAELLGT